MESPFHAGELEVQARFGEAAQAQRTGTVIGNSIRPGVFPFIADQPMAVLGSVDANEDVWASMILGHPGFIKASDPRKLEVDLSAVSRNPHDPLWANVRHDPRLGVLLIELETRRRLRINGRVEPVTGDIIRLTVDEAYANCPKYIQRRQLGRGAIADYASGLREGTTPDSTIRRIVRSADTFFVASMAPQGSLDASHRGGPPGFTRLVDDRTLQVPDYPGNSMYNTLGNFAINPRAGLLFVDFEDRRSVQLTGRAEIRWDLTRPTAETGGTGRYWDFVIDRWIETALPAWARWTYLDASPFNPEPKVVSTT